MDFHFNYTNVSANCKIEIQTYLVLELGMDEH